MAFNSAKTLYYKSVDGLKPIRQKLKHDNKRKIKVTKYCVHQLGKKRI